MPTGASQVQRTARVAECPDQLFRDAAARTVSGPAGEADQGHPCTGHQPGVNSFEGRRLGREYSHPVFLKPVGTIRGKSTPTGLLRREAELPQMLVANARVGTGASERQATEARERLAAPRRR